MQRKIALFILSAVAGLLALSFQGCGAGGGGSTGTSGGDWYYHWRCHGDPQCIATNPNGTADGDINEGPLYQMCSPMLHFSAINWSPPAEDACTQSPTWSGTPAPTVTSIVVTPANPSINTGQTKQFTATAHYSNGTATVVTTSASWNSNTTSIATIGGTGLATAVSSGTSTIKATYMGVAGSTTLNVNPNFSITSFSPQSAAPGTNLTLTGVNFPATSVGTTVKICGLVATIVSESSTQIVVTIPGITSTQECTVTVTTSGGTAVGSGTLVVLVGAHGSSVYWTERGFGGNLGQGSVKMMGKTAGSAVYALATGLYGPWKLVGDVGHLYWLEYQNGVTGAVNQMSIAGGASSFIQAGVPVPSNIGLDSVNVYWSQMAGSSPGSLHKASLITYSDDLVVGGTYGEPAAVTGDGSKIYFTVNGSSNVYQTPIAAIPSVTVLGTGPAPTGGYICYPTSMAVDALSVYWVNVCGGATTSTDNAVYKANLSSGVVTTLTSGGFGMNGTSGGSVLIDATNVYWSTGTGLYKVPIAGGAMTTLATGYAVLSAAQDSTDIYFTDGSSILRVSKSGGTITTLASGLLNPFGVYVDP